MSGSSTVRDANYWEKKCNHYITKSVELQVVHQQMQKSTKEEIQGIVNKTVSDCFAQEAEVQTLRTKVDEQTEELVTFQRKYDEVQKQLENTQRIVASKDIEIQGLRKSLEEEQRLVQHERDLNAKVKALYMTAKAASEKFTAEQAAAIIALDEENTKLKEQIEQLEKNAHKRPNNTGCIDLTAWGDGRKAAKNSTTVVACGARAASGPPPPLPPMRSDDFVRPAPRPSVSSSLPDDSIMSQATYDNFHPNAPSNDQETQGNLWEFSQDFPDSQDRLWSPPKSPILRGPY